jgi:hypothetical protein
MIGFIRRLYYNYTWWQQCTHLTPPWLRISHWCLASSLLLERSLSRVESYVTTDGQSASLSRNKAPIWGLWPDFLLLSDSCGFVDVGCSLWRDNGSVVYNCCWPALASAVILGSEYRGGHILLFHIQDIPFCRLLRLAGLQWRYSTPPPRGIPSPTHGSFLVITVMRPW